MMMRHLLPALEHAAGIRRMAAQQTLSRHVMRHMNTIVPAEYFAQLGVLKEYLEREKRRHHYWMRVRIHVDHNAA